MAEAYNDALANQPVVIDNGSGGLNCSLVHKVSSVIFVCLLGVLKAGFAGVDKPRVVFRSYVGRTKHLRVMAGGALEGTDM